MAALRRFLLDLWLTAPAAAFRYPAPPRLSTAGVLTEAHFWVFWSPLTGSHGLRTPWQPCQMFTRTALQYHTSTPPSFFPHLLLLGSDLPCYLTALPAFPGSLPTFSHRCFLFFFFIQMFPLINFLYICFCLGVCSEDLDKQLSS